MDDEHGAFWVSIVDQEETIMETHKDLSVVAIFPDEEEFKSSFQHRSQIESLYQLFLNQQFDQIKAILSKTK